MEPLTFSLVAAGSLLLAIRFGNMSDKKKIETIMSRQGISIKDKDVVRKCKFVRKNKILYCDQLIGIEYIYRLPLGVGFSKIEENIHVFENGLHKNLEIEFKYGMVHFSVYETDLPKEWEYESDNRQDV